MSQELQRRGTQDDARAVIEKPVICADCGIPKYRSEFYAYRGGSIQKRCKECAAAKVRKNRSEKIDYYREYDRLRANAPDRIESRKQYQHTEAGKAALYRNTRNQIERFPEKVRARNLVSKALKSGRLRRQPCEVCESPKSQAHHEDYGKPLEVRWLCVIHHKEADGHLSEQGGLRR